MNAAIREYVSNAYDANVEAGVTKPVELTLPCTENDGLLMVKDYMGIVSVFANSGPYRQGQARVSTYCGKD